jgi:hypothetical protein
MKKILPFLLLIFGTICSYSQTTPEQPTDITASKYSITGKTKEEIVLIYFENIKEPITVETDKYGKFYYEFENVLTGKEIITITSQDKNEKESAPKKVDILTDEQVKAKLNETSLKLKTENENIILLEIQNKKIESEIKKSEQVKLDKQIAELESKGYKIEKKDEEVTLEDVITKIDEIDAEKYALRNTTLTYGAQILSTNFTIPLVRFNFVNSDTQKQGDILLFTSIGAGVGYYWGQLERTRDDKGEIINEEFRNRFGVNLGFLFSAGTGSETTNVFAPVFNFAVLDFQIGIGVELGTRAKNQKKEFLTISYAIPIYKLFKKGYRLYTIEEKPNDKIRKSLN